MGQFIPGVITHSRIPTESHVRVSASLGIYFPTYAIEDLAVSGLSLSFGRSGFTGRNFYRGGYENVPWRAVRFTMYSYSPAIPKLSHFKKKGKGKKFS